MPRPSPLKAAVAARGLTIKSLAHRVGCSPAALYNVSSGRAEPWPKLRSDLEQELGFDPFTAERVPDPAAVARLVDGATAQGHGASVTDARTLTSVATIIGRPA